MAPTSRILAYVQGLKKYDLNCDVLTMTPKAKEHYVNENSNGIVNDVTFFNAISYDPKSSSIKRVFFDLRFRRLKAAILLLNERKKSNIDLVLISCDLLKYLLFFVPFLKIFGFKIAFITDEFPPEIRRLKSKVSQLNKKLYIFVNKFFLFRITMTRTLMEYYNREFGVKPSIIMNSIVDIHRFDSSTKIREKFFFESTDIVKLCYMGNMELEKDNVDNIIIAANILKKTYPNFQLHLYGIPKQKGKKIIESLISKFQLENNIQFKGRVNFNDVPNVLIQYDILVSSQPRTERAAGGFPTKLGEYLMSGVPTLTTDVGEISEYVSNGKHLTLVQPEDPTLYAESLIEIIKNYDRYCLMADFAKIFVKQNFSNEYVTKDIACFILKKLENN
jgi:glycosyltransferase involved in cell wall biosynthesis